MSRLEVLIVDDEPLARERIRDLLADEGDVEIVGECKNGKEAVASLEAHTPDLVFLDVQMPDLDGFGVLEEVDPERIPAVIFVTAFDEYAVKAFEVHALDYILKPFDRARFRTALDRARESAPARSTGVADAERPLDARLVSLLQELQDRKARLDRLVIKSGGRVFFLRTGEIDWIEAAGNYVELHVGKDSHLLRETMNNLESRLDPELFLRIHRRLIVNLERIQQLEGISHGEYVVVLKDGTRLNSSRGYREGLHRLLDGSG